MIRFLVTRRVLPLAAALCLACCALAADKAPEGAEPAGTAPAQGPTIYPFWPEEGEIVTSMPILRIGYRGKGLDRLRFRIVLKRPDGAAPLHTYEQSKDESAWRMYLQDEDPGVGFRPAEPLEDGPYVWRAAMWDGKTWIESGEERSFIVDGVPPQPVLAIRIRRNPEKGTIAVEWDPVTKDRDGKPETDLRYRLYRYEPRPFFEGLLLNELALTETPSWEDHDPKAIHSPTLFYVIKPVDAAGNEPEEP